MKIFRINKNQLKWKEMNQINYNWKLPILVNHKREVIAGNSLYDILPENIIICVIEKNQLLEDNLQYIEEKVVEENKVERFGTIDSEIREYFKELRKPPSEQLSLFDDIKDNRCISEENYKRPNAEITYSHGRKNDVIDYQLYLLDEEIAEKEIKSSLDEIEVDLEILKELL